MSEAEDLLASQLTFVGISYVRQAKFCPGRRYACDFAMVEHGLIVEVQGGGYNSGRHHRAAGYAADCERMGRALALGWRMLYVTPQQVTSGEALRMVQEALAAPERPELPSTPAKRPARSKRAKSAQVTDNVAAIMQATGCDRARAEAIVEHNARRGG